jgi:hypothetical protein
MRNKLGVAYSVFDDLEHLEQSLRSVRNNVDYIVIVYQNISYTGNLASFNVYKKLSKFLNDGLVDNIQEYKPDFKITIKGNEVRKRNMGLDICSEHYCTHYITMDGDEIFIPKQLKNAKKIVYDYNYKASFVFSRTYYMDKKHIIYPPERYHIPFIYKIGDGRFKLDTKIDGIIADRSRKMTDIENDFIIFDRKFIEMHHLCYIRNNMDRKMKNKASNISNDRINNILKSYNNFKKWRFHQQVYTENGIFNVKRLLISKL